MGSWVSSLERLGVLGFGVRLGLWVAGGRCALGIMIYD